MKALQKEIENEYTSYINNNGVKPNAVYVKVKWYDEEETSKNVETVVIDENNSFYSNDDEVLFYVSNINSVLQLCEDNNGEDFVITEFIGFENIKNK